MNIEIEKRLDVMLDKSYYTSEEMPILFKENKVKRKKRCNDMCNDCKKKCKKRIKIK